MRTSRRNFLKWSGIGALGTVAFVGCGIPEEELLVQSSAQMPEDLVSGMEAWYATSCGQCGAGEGVIVRIIEGRAIKIEGNPDHPISQGKSSVRCQAGLQTLYNPTRLQTPMRRNGARGSGVFIPISWDEALAEVAGHLQRQTAGSTVLATEPLRGSLGMVARRFADAHGGRHMAYEAMEETVLRAAMSQVFGQDQIPDFDIEHADYVLNFGADFLSTWLSPVCYGKAYGGFRHGERQRGTLVHVDPRFSMTAANADRWLYVNPGWEGVLAMSIAYVLVSDHGGSINQAAVQAMTGGAGASAWEAFNPETVAGDVGVSAEHIRQLASELANHHDSMVIGGGSTAAHTNGLFNLSAIYALNYLLGSVGREGGILFNPAPPLEDVPPITNVASFAEWEALTDEIRDGSVKLLLVHGTDPVYGMPASVGFREALEQIETVVSFSSFIDETSAMADLILPDQVYLESWGDDIPEPGSGYQTVTFQQPVVRPFQAGTRPFGDVLLALAQRTGNGMPWGTMKDVLRANAQALHSLGRGSVQAANFEAFWNTVLQRGGWWDLRARGMAQLSTAPQAPTERQAPSFEGPTGTDTFYLLPFSSGSLTDGKGANLPWLQATPDPLATAAWQTWAEINARTADEMDIKEGDELELQSPTGSIKVLAYPNPAAAPGVIGVPTGQGHTHYGDFEIGPDLSRSLVGKDRGANVFSVLASGKKVDGTGALAWAATRVKVQKTGEFRRLTKLEGAVLATPPGEFDIVPVIQPEY